MSRTQFYLFKFTGKTFIFKICLVNFFNWFILLFKHFYDNLTDTKLEVIYDQLTYVLNNTNKTANTYDLLNTVGFFSVILKKISCRDTLTESVTVVTGLVKDIYDKIFSFLY